MLLSEYKIKVCVALSLVVFFVSCKRDIDDECPKCPRVTALTPSAAHFDDTVLISGKHLLPNPNYNDVLQVKFNGNLIPGEYIIENYDDSIRLIIPKGTQSGPVTVDINVADELVSAGSAQFTYLFRYNVSTYAGSGVANTSDNTDPLLAEFYFPQLLTVNPVNGDLFVFEFTSVGGRSIRRIAFSDGVTTLISPPGNLNGITADNGGQVYGTNYDCTIKKLVYVNASWQLANYAGIPGQCTHVNGNISIATFSPLNALSFDMNNNMYVSGSIYIRRISSNGIVSDVAGDGNVGSDDGADSVASFNNPQSIVYDYDGSIYVTDLGNHKIRKISGGFVSTAAGTGNQGFSNGAALSSDLTYPEQMASDYEGNLYFTESNYHSIRKLNLLTSTVSVFAGSPIGAESGYQNGSLSESLFKSPWGLAYDRARKILYVADAGNHVIRKITAE